MGALARHLRAEVSPAGAPPVLRELQRLEGLVSAAADDGDPQTAIVRRLEALLRTARRDGAPETGGIDSEAVGSISTAEEMFALLDRELGGS